MSCRTENENDLTNAQAYHRKNSAQEITRLEGKRCALGRDARRQRMLLLVNQLVPHHADPEGRREGCRAPGALEESNSRGYEEQRPPPEPSTSPCGREGPRLRGGPIRPAQGSVTRHKTARHEARQERGRKIRKPNGDRGKPMRRSGECLIPSGFERLATDSQRNH